MSEKIQKIYAWICTEPDGDQGIPAMEHDGMFLPLIGADLARIESLRPYAQKVAADGLPVDLVCFSDREVLETLVSAKIKKH